MTMLLPLLIGIAAGGLLGLCIGWLVRGRDSVVVEKVVTVDKIVERTLDDVVQNSDRANEILAQLQQLTTGVSAQIDEHSRTVGDINEELTSASQAEGSAVMAAVQRLIESNNAMQSQLHTAQEQLQQQSDLLQVQQEEARTDPLTKLRNRRAFDDELSRLVAAGEAAALMMLDVDHFKKCNDTYGHLAGDEVLRMVGRTLAAGAAAQTGVFAARFGGEEFVLLFSAQALVAAAECVDRIRREIEQSTVKFGDDAIVVTASAGVAAMQAGENDTMVISRADEALYFAKRSGRNCTCIHEDGRIRKLTTIASSERTAPNTIDSCGVEPMSKAISRRIAEWRRGGARLSLIVARIDNLAALEASGVQERDLALKHAGEYLHKILREMDQVGLIAGEIFGMLLPTAGVVDGLRVAQRMRDGVDQGDLDETLGAHITISFGVAEVMAEDDADSLVLRARRAMEAARRRGGNAVYFNDGVYSAPSQDLLDAAASNCEAVS
jgi:diguanylate cyclase